MRVMTFNIQHGLDYQNQRIDLPLFVRAIRDEGADLCGLNEVRNEGCEEGYTDQVGTIGKGLGFASYFGEAIRFRGMLPYGNGLVSRCPLLSAETVAIPDPESKDEDVYYETRCVIRATIALEEQPVMVLVCHMGLAAAERQNAVAVLCRLLDENHLPAIVMGDFNTVPEDPVLRPLFDRLEDTDRMASSPGYPTFPSYGAERKIDYILYRGLRCRSSRTVAKIVSDHYALISDFDLNR